MSHNSITTNKQNDSNQRKRRKKTTDPDKKNLPVILTFGPQSWADFEQLLRPQSRLLKTARYFVFNMLGTYVKMSSSTTKFNQEKVSYVCTCDICHRKQQQHQWKITFQRVPSYPAPEDPLWLFDTCTDRNHIPHPTFHINSHHVLANFQLFQKFLHEIFYLDTCCPSPEVFTVRVTATKQRKQNIRKFNYAKRAFIQHKMQFLVTKDNPEFYKKLPSYVKCLAEQNPRCFTSLQADSNSRFYRFFCVTLMTRHFRNLTANLRR